MVRRTLKGTKTPARALARVGDPLVTGDGIIVEPEKVEVFGKPVTSSGGTIDPEQ